MFTLVGPPLRALVWPMPNSFNKFCSVFKNVPFSHPSFASDSSSSALLNDVKGKYPAQIDQLSASITEFCSDSFERNRKLHAQIRPVVADLERAVCASGKRSRLVLIGSIASGMAFDDSADINLAFFYAGDTQQQREQFMEDFCGATTALSPFRRTFMEAIAVALENFYDEKPSGYRMTRRPSIISTYRVPVVFGWFDNGRQFDIQFPRADFQSVRNTLMVRYYVQADRRFLLLFHWLRRVFTQMRLKTNKGSFFTSYQMLLLVLHFLSRKEVPDNVLPAFDDFPAQMREQMFTPDVANIVRTLDEPPSSERLHFWTSKCAKSVGELAVELVDYYARFDPLTTAISIQHGLTKKQNATLKDRRRLNVYDPFHPSSVTHSSALGEALVLAFQFLRGQMTDGKHLTTFPRLLDGLAEEFAIHAHRRGISWAKDFKRMNGYTPTGKFEQSSEKQENREQSQEEHGVMGREENDVRFEQSPEEDGVMEGEMKDVRFEQSLEEQQDGVMEGEVKGGEFEQSLEEQHDGVMEGEVKGGEFEQPLEEQHDGVMEGKEEDVRFEQSLEDGVMEREEEDVRFEQSAEEDEVMKGKMKDVRFEQSPEEDGVIEGKEKDSGFEQYPEEQHDGVIEGKEKDSGFEQSPEEQHDEVMKGEMKDVRFEQSPEEDGVIEGKEKDSGFEQYPEEQHDEVIKGEMKGGGIA